MNANSLNYNYPMRRIEVRELVALFGSAREALDKTGADDALALLFIHNPTRVVEAGRVTPTQSYLCDALKGAVRAEKLVEEKRAYDARVESAAVVYNEKRTLAAIQSACKCGHAMAKSMLEDARWRGLIKAA